MTSPVTASTRWDARDPDQFLRDALDWHFNPETGSALWLRIAETLDFDPRTDISSYEDLARFPDIAAHLRTSRVEDLIPRGLGRSGAPPLIYETGGTTGSPKRLIYSASWIERCLRWKVDELRAAGFPAGRPWLVAMPSGPHAYGNTARLQARELGSLLHSIDIDPRWVKKSIADGAAVDGYVAHLVEQIGHIVQTQDIAAVTTTPPILAEIILRPELVDKLAATVSYIALAGAQLDDDTFDIIAETFPGARIQNVYGSTMVLTTARIRDPLDPAPRTVYDAYPPHTIFAVVDPETLRPVDYGRRGQVRMSHLSDGMFVPNNLERDTAIRVAAPPGGIGDSLSAPQPLGSFDGETVIPGVY
ncbi:phenazine antibiotic biosynthesis protein [Nocardia sp. NPDC050717]|uniref:phenazine antibiotic biosynthesis protein n=1 Tax=Nocardia sp. NPDC050717 TaxID=3157221 RepID=UPI003411349C